MAFSRQFPDRAMGSPGSRAATAWIAEQFQAAGLQVEIREFEAVAAGNKLRGINVVATLAGAEEPAVWVLAPHDMVPGGQDNASGIGVLIELARNASQAKPRRTHRFIAADGAAWGMLGSRRLADEIRNTQSLAPLVLTLECASGKSADAILLESNGSSGGNTPAWMRQLAWQSLQSAGISTEASSGFTEHTLRALNHSSSAPGPFLARGVPALGLRCLSTSPAGPCGQAAATFLAALEAQAGVSTANAGDFHLAGNHWVPSAWVRLAQWICFVPLAFAAFHAWHSTRVRLSATSSEPEWFSLLGAALPWLTGYAVLCLCHAMGWMTRYEALPAPEQLRGLDVDWIPLGCALLAGLLMLVLIRFIRGEREIPYRCNQLAARTYGILLLTWLSLASLILNSYWAATFLLVPALLWPLLPEERGIRRSQPDTQGAWMLILAGVLPLFACLIGAGFGLSIGWRSPWYLVLACLTGAVHPAAAALAILLVALSWRMLVAHLKDSLA